MSELPSELRSLVAQVKREFEPDAERLSAVAARLAQRVDLGNAPPAEFDLAAPKAARGLARVWWTIGSAVLMMSAVWMRTAEPIASAPHVTPEKAPAMAPIVERLAPTASVVRQPASAAAPASESRPRVTSAPSVEPVVLAAAPAPVVVAEQQARPAHAVDETVKSARKHERRALAAQDARPAARPAAAPQVSEQRDLASLIDVASIVAAQEAPAHEDQRVTRAAASSAEASLQKEVALIARAQQAVARGDHRAAERALSEHQLAHPVGQLQAERTALLARARCLAGDLASARRLHAQLSLLAPRSSLSSSVERACPALAR